MNSIDDPINVTFIGFNKDDFSYGLPPPPINNTNERPGGGCDGMRMERGP